MKYDLLVIGGGLAGCSAAIISAKLGLKTLIIEKNSFLGGSASGALVLPMMKNIQNSLSYKNLMNYLGEDAFTFKDGNIGWFNPEILKCKLDELCKKNGVDILFDTIVTGCKKAKNKILSIESFSFGQKKEIIADYYLDASGNADFAYLTGAKMLESEDFQSLTLRFIMANINVEKFADFLEKIDPDSELSPIDKTSEQIHLSCAYTADNDCWKLKPIFEQAIQNGDLSEENGEYFQIFTIPNQIGAIGFNCPRIYADKKLNPTNNKDTSYALVQGRKQILEIANFVKKYFIGFENAYISQIAPMLGIRNSRQIEGKYILNEEDILTSKKSNNEAFSSNYPIDVHSYQKNGGKLIFASKDDYYSAPIEIMQSVSYENLFAAGRCISATYLAQASLRIMPNCITMGENIAKHIANLKKFS